MANRHFPTAQKGLLFGRYLPESGLFAPQVFTVIYSKHERLDA